ncbi:hypothetical protein [Mycobacterium sp.]|uniref:hypothetical protein n=1 Tax=Mycobacterium sp. TaxID=1785 RepID=UPI003BB5FB33
MGENADQVRWTVVGPRRRAGKLFLLTFPALFQLFIMVARKSAAAIILAKTWDTLRKSPVFFQFSGAEFPESICAMQNFDVDEHVVIKPLK